LRLNGSLVSIQIPVLNLQWFSVKIEKLLKLCLKFAESYSFIYKKDFARVSNKALEPNLGRRSRLFLLLFLTDGRLFVRLWGGFCVGCQFCADV
jgi:hypothetical protein